MPRRAVLTVALAAALLVAGASPGASDDEHVTWAQVRDALAARHGDRDPERLPGRAPVEPPDPAPAGSAVIVVSVTVPDLSWALDDPTAPAGVRRAACHQALGLDDETLAPLAACLAHVDPEAVG